MLGVEVVFLEELVTHPASLDRVFGQGARMALGVDDNLKVILAIQACHMMVGIIKEVFLGCGRNNVEVKVLRVGHLDSPV